MVLNKGSSVGSPNNIYQGNLFSKMFVTQAYPLLKLGERRQLELDDVFTLPKPDSAENMGLLIERYWKRHVKECDMTRRPAHLWKALWQVIRGKFMLLGLAYFFHWGLIRNIQPVALKGFVQSFESNEVDAKNKEQNRRYYGIILVSATFVDFKLFQALFTETAVLAMKLRNGLSSLIYKKMLKLDKTSHQANVGKICNLLSIDLMVLDSHLNRLHYLWVTPLQLTICMYLLWRELGGFACITGLSVIFVLLPVQRFVGRFARKYRLQIGKASDARGKFLAEVISSVRLIKLYAWEKPFSELIAKLRKQEIEAIRKSHYMQGLVRGMKVLPEKLVPFCVLVVYTVVMKQDLSTDKAVFAMTLFNIIHQAVTGQFLKAMLDWVELKASLQRIQEFLCCEELVIPDQNEKNVASENAGPQILMNNYSARWNKGTETLQNLNLDIYGNKLVMVIGHVGAGKSSLLQAVISELPIIGEKSELCVNGSISYASQEAWIFPGTVRENILFGLELDQNRYRNVLKICQLEEDLEQWPNGDKTLVGERGVILSGGQKARVNFGRAIYQNADIYLLDDPLSAVDKNVCAKLLQDGIIKYLGNKLTLLVTHQLQYLHLADHIIVMNRNGSILCQGTFDEIRSNAAVNFDNLMTETSLIHKNNQKLNKVSEFGLSNGEKTTLSKQELVGAKISGEQPEIRKSGAVKLSTYINFFSASGNKFAILLVILAMIVTQFLLSLNDYWYSMWKNTENQVALSYFLILHCFILTGYISGMVLTPNLFRRECTKSSENLHNAMFRGVIRASMKFFEDNSSGRVISRMTSDMHQIDEKLSLAFYDFWRVFINFSSMLIVCMATNCYATIPSILLLLGIWKLRSFYLKTSRNLKRLEAVVKSPIFTQVGLTIQGLTTIRASKAEKRMLSNFHKLQNNSMSVHYTISIINKWFISTLETMTCTFFTTVCFAFLLLPENTTHAAAVSLVIYTILSSMTRIQFGMRQSAQVENQMISVERVLEYCELENEAALEMPGDIFLVNNWPSEGVISFDKVCLGYNEQTQVLKEISFQTRPQEKIGVVGRTGAGKSSLITALFRLRELSSGSIEIDGQNISNLGLHTLRLKISIIPQDPVLFSGTVRYNLDPFSEFEDEELWRALKGVDLQNKIASLDYLVTGGGENFSAGERQLMCLGRAMLRKNKILILDEATANVDPETDRLVQEKVREAFADCTVITIAHRLQTVLDSDRILVLDSGKIVEFDTPKALLEQHNNRF